MIAKIIELSIKNKFLVILMVLFVIAAGIYAMLRTPLDAIPDLSDAQVIIFTEYSGQAPQVVEDQVTYPLTTAMLSVPYARVVRGYSFFGLSFVYIIFEDGTDIYWARSRVLEYLNYVSSRLPAGVTPTLGPDATGVGWVYEYILESDRHDLAQLRSIQDWFLRFELASVPGVAEVASIGGYVKQYQVIVDPNKLIAFNIPLQKIRTAIQRSNNDVGGRLVEMGETEFMVRGLGYIKGIEDLQNIPLGVSQHGTPILLRNVATIKIGPELRRGLADYNGTGEVVGGVVVMRFGENALKVIRNVKKRLVELKTGLPEGVRLKTVYDRSSLILRAVNNLKKTLIEESVIIALVCIIFLFHFRSALVGILTLPLGVFISFIIMERQGINANIMSLGGIAIAMGAMVDAAIVMIENAHKHIERDKGKKPHWDLILDAAKEVGPALFFSLLIIAISFLPVFTLEAQEGRLFRPLAFTKTYAMMGSALLAITIVPVLMGYMIRGKIRPERKNPVNRFLIWIYHPVIKLVLKAKILVILLAVAVLAVTYIPWQRIGSEFMPPLNEGDLLYMPTTLPGISITKAKELLQQTDRIIASFPEVHHVFGKVGRAETATDPAPLSMIETTIMLKPESEWREGMTMKKLVNELDKAIQFPGLTNAWTMPIKTRIDMLSTGIKTPVGIKIMGEDLQVLSDLGEKVEAILRDVPGTLSVYSERVTGGNFLDFRIKRLEAARYGLTVGDVQDIIMTAVGGMNITRTVEGRERYPVNLRYGSEFRDTPEKLRRILVPTPTGAQVPITQLADIRIVRGPPVIKSENARNNAWVYVDIRDIDVGTYVKRAQEIVGQKIKLPPGYSMVWSGQYEYMVRAQKRLMIVVPLTLIIIFLLLYFSFKNIGESLIVMLSVPFSLTGGLWLMYFLGYNMSVAVGVGFIALAGVAAETGVVMLIYLDISYNSFKATYGEKFNRKHLRESIEEGAALRVRPKMMTVVAIMAGLMPIMWSHGTGSEVIKRIAAPMVGGMVSATILTLIVVPAIYGLWKGWWLKN
ncbi:MAG: efflux RND transporter permease subunit [Deltaproteobacteria bacterium]|nr:efflux RND transporter permease subunit [Deltaproteobacteria bacterium]MBW2118853.1 efflux RND transporter permease subunit [Deltaproteobacteria bacterium]MBW2343359.1 efflux RND transporter permease subunit [Deltaproteobacteria bacterium]